MLDNKEGYLTTCNRLCPYNNLHFVLNDFGFKTCPCKSLHIKIHHNKINNKNDEREGSQEAQPASLSY